MKFSFFKEDLIKTSYNLILIITDRLTKYKLFMLYKENFTAEELAYAFL